MNRYVDLALSGLDDWFDGGQADLTVLASEDETAVAFAQRHADALAAGQGSAIATDRAQAFGLDPTTLARDLSPEERQGLAQTALAFAALTPEFLLR